ncbi:MAG TPA: endonuclease/exonuclease/phosphatase family protein [Longimicrobium sp.]|nr:endonuclease/exonuclease/phosphatase family protein [Longimicrobium sp.]
MPQLRIMTWNIRNLGPTKLQHDDIMAAIARVVVQERPDIFVVLEINTTKDPTAEAIGAVMQAELQKAEAALAQNNNVPQQNNAPQNNNNNNAVQNNNNGGNNANNAFPNGRSAWDTYAISPNTGLEFYGFFIRDTRVVQPVPLTAAVPVLNTNNGTAVGARAFATFAGPGPCVLPLIRPNLTKEGQNHEARWTGARLPVFGLFNVAGAQDPYLPILAGHFAANQAQAERQMNLLAAFDVINDICVANANTPARPTVDAKANHKFGHLIVTGDFNVDFDPADYPNRTAIKKPKRWGSDFTSDGESDDSDPDFDGSGIVYDDETDDDNNNNNANPKKRRFYYGGLLHDPKPTWALGLKAVIVHKTHLMKPGKLLKLGREVKGTVQLASRCFDNFFVSPSVTASNSGVVDVPGQFKATRKPLRLNGSVQYYADWGMKDLKWKEYEVPGKDVVMQLLSKSGEGVSLMAALTGTALISDHLPVVMDFTIP